MAAESEQKCDSEKSEHDSFVASFEIPFNSTRDATIAYNSLRIDQEPLRGGVTKELEAKESLLIVRISSNDVRKLRSAVSSFFDFLILVVNTIKEYG